MPGRKGEPGMQICAFLAGFIVPVTFLVTAIGRAWKV
jgi:hypothetical protein